MIALSEGHIKTHTTRRDCLTRILYTKVSFLIFPFPASVAPSIEIKFEVIPFSAVWIFDSQWCFIHFQRISSHENIPCRCLYFIFLTHFSGPFWNEEKLKIPLIKYRHKSLVEYFHTFLKFFRLNPIKKLVD